MRYFWEKAVKIVCESPFASPCCYSRLRLQVYRVCF